MRCDDSAAPRSDWEFNAARLDLETPHAGQSAAFCCFVFFSTLHRCNVHGQLTHGRLGDADLATLSSDRSQQGLSCLLFGFWFPFFSSLVFVQVKRR